jgi:hypothetical protein
MEGTSAPVTNTADHIGFIGSVNSTADTKLLFFSNCHRFSLSASRVSIGVGALITRRVSFSQ